MGNIMDHFIDEKERIEQEIALEEIHSERDAQVAELREVISELKRKVEGLLSLNYTLIERLRHYEKER